MTFIIGTPHIKGAGYYKNDDRLSGGQLSEADVRTCPHCQAVILMQQWRAVENGKMAGGWCTRCNAPICGHCQKRMLTEGCTPFVEFIEKQLGEAAKLKVFKKLAGLDTPAAPSAPLITGTGV